MKFLNLLLFLFVSNISLAQNANVFISNFDVENPALKNGKIQYFNAAGDTSYNFRLSLGRNFATTPMPAIRITAIAVFDNYGTEYAASDSLYFTQSDFSAFTGTETPIISKKFTLKSNKKVGSLKIKYRFLVSYPGYSGWTNWFYSNKTYQTQQYEPPAPVIPDPTFTGPSSICSDGTYTITNPRTISLENASSIATLTALGNNQWKVTRIGNKSGVVILKSIEGVKKFEKKITVGTLPPKIIDGPTKLNWSNSATYTIGVESGTSDLLEVKLLGHTSITLTKLTNTTYILQAPSQPLPNSGPIQKSYTCSIEVRSVTNCGVSEYIKKEVVIGNSIPLE